MENISSNLNLVIIEHISPENGHGEYAIKAVSGDVIFVQADILTNGNSALAARIFYKNKEKNWQIAFMKPVGNDRWEGKFQVQETGSYVYKIVSWVDPIATWQTEINRRLQKYLPVADLIPEGLKLLEQMSKLSSKEDKALIKEAVRLFKDKNRVDEAGQLAGSFRFTEWLNRYPDNRLSSETAEFSILVYRKKLEFSSWYTMFPRSASDDFGIHGTFKDVVKRLPGIADLGFDVLHFPPIHPIGFLNKKSRNGGQKADESDPGSPFSIGNFHRGHESIHPELGSIDDFKNLVSEAEKLGVEIALDFALQFSADHPWVAEYPDWFEKNVSEQVFSSGQLSSVQPDYYNIRIDENNEEAVTQALEQIIRLWVSWGIQIIRVVQPDKHPFYFWQKLIKNITEECPDLIFYAGTFTRPKVMNTLSKSGFALSDSYFIWRNGKYELEQYINELAYSSQKDFYKPIFWTNTPDINPFNLQSGHEPQQLIRFFLAATLSGSYGIYGPVFEQLFYESFPGKEEYWNSEKFEIKHWDWEKDTKVNYLIRLINTIRKENPALQKTNNVHTCFLENDQIMAFLKNDFAGNKLLCVVNLDSYHRQSGMVQVPVHMINKNHDETFIAHDLITDARYEWKGEWNYVELDPHILPFHILRIEDYHGEIY
ncbi:MAG: maltotransferase domain-containing protein [Dyadobacter sp.]